MGIVDEDIARVRDQTDMVALVSEKVALKRVGQRYSGLCPFHQEKTPSFSVNPELHLFHCFAGETKVITWEGLRPIRELAGTTARVLTKQGRWVDAPFRSFGRQQLYKLTVERNRVIKDIYTTSGHRWFVRHKNRASVERTTLDLRVGDPLAWSFTRGQLEKNVRLSPNGVAQGIVFGDGSRFNKGACVDLHGEKDAELLKWFPLNHSYQCKRPGHRGGPDQHYLKVVDLPGYFKDLPSSDESASFLLGWLAGYFAADGCVAEDGTVILSSANREHLEFVRLVCLRVGIGTYGITEQRQRGFGRPDSSLYRIDLFNEDLIEDFFLLSEHRRRFAGTHKATTRRGWVVKNVEPTDRVEEVYCAVVPGFHAFALEDHILTGNCFGCGKSGDAITWVRETDGLDFVDAVEELAKRAGVTLRYDDRTKNRDRSRRDRLVEAVTAAGAFYHRLLLESPEGGVARKYLRGRGFDGDAARRFVLGWAPDDWDMLSKHLQREKFSREDLTDAGLAFVNKANRLQDQFRARLIFPIYDARGDAVGFGGRSLGEQGPKYKNSPETPIYQKSRLLYGLNWAKAEIVARREVIICEGYTDVMAYALAGNPNAVATCGTALADEHAKTLKNLARRVVLAYDADAAGQGAAERWYRWEQELELEVRVADLPSGKDPGDLWNEDRDRLPASIEGAEPFLQFRVDRVLAGADLSTIEGRARAAATAAAIVAEHPSELVRDQYAVQLAERLDLAADGLRGQIVRPEGQQPPGSVPPRGDESPPPDPDDYGAPPVVQVNPREADVLLWAIHQPKLVADWLDESLFLDPTARAAYTLLAEHDDVPAAIDAAEGPARQLLERLAVEEPDEGDERETLPARLLAYTVEPVAKRVLVRMLRDDDANAGAVKARLDVLAHAREVGQWDDAQDAAKQLVGWIVHEARPAPPSAEGERVDAETRVDAVTVEQQA